MLHSLLIATATISLTLPHSDAFSSVLLGHCHQSKILKAMWKGRHYSSVMEQSEPSDEISKWEKLYE